MLLIGPICLDNIPQISRFLPVVQGKDLRDPVSPLRLALVCIKRRATGEVESGVFRPGQGRGVSRRVVVLVEINRSTLEAGQWASRRAYLDFHEVTCGPIENSKSHLVEAF